MAFGEKKAAKPGDKAPAKRRERKPPRKPNAARIENVALHYLQRYAATEASLRRVLDRRVAKARPHHPDLDLAACAEWIGVAVEKAKRLGYIDDAAYAVSKAASLRRGGASARKIEQKLAEKGIRTKVEHDPEAEQAAAEAYVKRRRLGAWRTRVVENARDKDLASLARGGFSRQTALLALENSKPFSG